MHAPRRHGSIMRAIRRLQDHSFRVALGSFIEEYKNKVEIVQLDESTGGI